VWNLAAQGQGPEATIPARGPVNCISVSGNNIMWSDEEPQENDAPGVPVAVIHLLNTTNMTTVPIKVRDGFAKNEPFHF
jgi:hypothetical protein